MYKHRPCLAMDFNFPHNKGHGETPMCWQLHCWVTWTAVRSLQRGSGTVHIRGRETEAALQYKKLMPFHWNQVTWSWLKLMCTKGRERWRTSGRSNHMKWNARWLRASLPTSWENQWTRCSWVLHWNQLIFIAPTEGTPLCVIVWAKWARCTITTLDEQTPEETGTERAPQSLSCLLLTQHQTGETPLGWMNSKLNVSTWTCPEPPC